MGLNCSEQDTGSIPWEDGRYSEVLQWVVWVSGDFPVLESRQVCICGMCLSCLWVGGWTSRWPLLPNKKV